MADLALDKPSIVVELSKELKLPTISEITLSANIPVEEIGGSALQQHLNKMVAQDQDRGFRELHGVSKHKFEEQPIEEAKERAADWCKTFERIQADKREESGRSLLGVVSYTKVDDAAELALREVQNGDGSRAGTVESEIRAQVEREFPLTAPSGDINPGVNIAQVARIAGADIPANVDVIASEKDGGAYLGIRFTT